MFWQQHHLPSVPSTNRWALEWLRQHVPQGPVLFTTDHQTEGRGQRDRRWSSEAGRDVCLSLALPVQKDWHPACMNMEVALSVHRVLTELLPATQTPEAVQVKWPNDVLVWHAGEHRKVAGILVENMWRGNQWTTAVIGIGVNVDSSRLTRSYPAVSLSEAWQTQFDPRSLALKFAEAVVTRLNRGPEACTQELSLNEYHEALFALGEVREFVVHERRWKGRLMGVNQEGIGRFEWLANPESGQLPPSEWLPSSEVQWCW